MRNAPNDLGRAIGRRVGLVVAALVVLGVLMLLGLVPVSFAP